MPEMDDGPGRARRASKEREDDNPREEEDRHIGCPHPGIREPLRILVQIRSRFCFHVETHHSNQNKNLTI